MSEINTKILNELIAIGTTVHFACQLINQVENDLHEAVRDSDFIQGGDVFRQYAINLMGK